MDSHYFLTFLHLVSESNLVAFGANTDLVAIPIFSEAYLDPNNKQELYLLRRNSQESKRSASSSIAETCRPKGLCRAWS